MTLQHKRLVRQAVRIHRQWMQAQTEEFQLALPSSLWEQCQRSMQLLLLSRERNWQHAAERVENELRNSLAELLGRLHWLEPLLGSQKNADFVSLSDLYADLVALQREFTDVEINCQERTISVTTEPIEFDEIYLGPFKICLKWDPDNKDDPFSYRVVAVDPHPAASNESITHPHVQDETLCEGEGQLSLRLALEQGRALDFFTIVANLLRTYNSSSPYVSLTDWHGVDCADCGRTVDDDDRWNCEKCETTVCDQCYYCCADCDSIFCSECVGPCSVCSEQHCHRCLQVCTACLAEVCKECLNEQELCPSCQDQTEETNESQVEIEQIPHDIANLAIQPDCLGETAVST